MCNDFINKNNKDINKFKNIEDIEKHISGFEAIQSNKEIKKEQKEQIYKDTIFLYNKNNYLVIVPKTQEASCFWGLETEWCTAKNLSNIFNDYNRNNPFYICITPDGKKYQFHKNSEPMDQNDNPIDNITDPVLRELALITGKIKNIKEINYQSKREALISCQNYGLSIQNMPRDTPNFDKYCLESVKQNGFAIEYIPRDVSNYEECYLEACKKNVIHIDMLRRDISNFYKCKEVIFSNNYYNSKNYLEDSITHTNLINKMIENENYLEACKLNPHLIQSIHNYTDNQHIYERCCLIACDGCYDFINGDYVVISIQEINRDKCSREIYEECCLKLSFNNPDEFYKIPKDISNYYECCLEAVKQDGYVIKHIPCENLSQEQYKTCCLESCKQNGLVINSIPKDISNYEDCYQKSYENLKDNLQWKEEDVLKNEKFLNKTTPIIKKENSIYLTI